MALTASQQWRITIAGAETNGGGFDPSLTAGMLTDGAATSATGAAPVFTSVSYSFAAGDVGALLYVASGTNWTPGWYPIASVAGGAATLTAAIDATLGGARLATYGSALTVAGCATVASPTGATFTIDYSPLAAAIVSTTDLTSTNSTTMTSTLTTLTPVMVGNILRIASGTGATTGYYAIATYVSASQITVDRVSGTYTAGVSKVGGAFATLRTLCATASAGGAPALTSPLAAGHLVNIKGSGSDDSATVDYNEAGQYYNFVAGTNTGTVRWVGYNGRPVIGYQGLLFYQTSLHYLENLKGKQTAATFTTQGFAAAGTSTRSYNCIFDQNGNDAILFNGHAITCCLLKNTGSTSAGTNPAFTATAYNPIVCGNEFVDIRGYAMSLTGGAMATVSDNIIARTRATSTAAIQVSQTATFTVNILRNTFDDCDAGCIKLVAADDCFNTVIVGNIFSNCAGVAVNFAVGTTALNDARNKFCDYNCYYNNGTNLANKSLGINDTNGVDPGYVDAANNNFAIGTALKELGFPRAFRTGSTSYTDPGASQRQEAGAGGGLLTAAGMAGGMRG